MSKIVGQTIFSGQWTRLLVCLCGMAFLGAGCVGGGGGIKTGAGLGAPVPPVTVTPEEALRQEYAGHPEFLSQPALRQIKAHYAYARGATGNGITVGMIDTAIDSSHLELAGKFSDLSGNINSTPDFNLCRTYTDAGDRCVVGPPFHGTAVGGILAANRGSETVVPPGLIHGVAFDAMLLSIGITLGSGSGRYNPIDLSGADISKADVFYALLFNAVNPQVTAINLSFGSSGNIESYTETDIRAAFPGLIPALAQASTPSASRTIHVWAAGNARNRLHTDGMPESASSVEIQPGLAARISELRGHTLAVVAVDENGVIAGFSNRCGIAKEYCLAAPGMGLTAPLPNIYCPAGTTGCYGKLTGTSMSAPLVTGGIALLAQHYREQLGNDEITQRILKTANKEGIYADSNTYGQGLLDLDAATRPVGGARMLSGQSLTGPSSLESLSTLSLGPVFGDALKRGLAGLETATFDELDAPFFRPLSAYVYPAVSGIRLEERLWSLGRDPRGTTSWKEDGFGFRMRLDRVAAEHRADWSLPGAGARVAEYQPGSFSLTRRTGNNELFIGLRSHPGWYFGLHATDGRTDSKADLIGAFTDDTAFSNPFLSFARNGAVAGVSADAGKSGFSIAAFHGAAQYGERRDNDNSKAMGMLAEYRLADTASSSIAVQAGWIREPNRLVGSRPGGAFGELGADTGFMGISARRRLTERWQALVSAHAGRSRPEIQSPGMLHDLSSLWSGAFTVGLMGENIGGMRGRLAVRLAQPLRIESGDVGIRWVSGRTPDRRVRVETTTLELEPSGRQFDLELTWALPWKGGYAYLAALTSRDAGHTRNEEDTALLFRYNRSF